MNLRKYKLLFVLILNVALFAIMSSGIFSGAKIASAQNVGNGSINEFPTGNQYISPAQRNGNSISEFFIKEEIKDPETEKTPEIEDNPNTDPVTTRKVLDKVDRYSEPRWIGLLIGGCSGCITILFLSYIIYKKSDKSA